jgi:hypothetical protein
LAGLARDLALDGCSKVGSSRFLVSLLQLVLALFGVAWLAATVLEYL